MVRPIRSCGSCPDALPCPNDQTVQAYIDRGAPPEKIVLGVPFYGRGWTGVADVDKGLYQDATGPAPAPVENGFADYHDLRDLPDNGFTRFWDSEAQVPWLFDGETFWTYDDPESLGRKTRYVRQNALGGVMFWELSGDTDDAELVDAIYTGLYETGAR